METCPACEGEMDLDDEQLQEGGVVSCGGCGTQFEVVNPHPLELKQLADDEDEDDDLDDEDDDFDDEDGDDEDDDEDEDGYDDEDDDRGYGEDEDEE